MKQIVAVVIAALNLSWANAIYNASFAEPHQFPYSVLVKRSAQHKFCTGAIISERHVITSAHCIVDSTDPVFITVGAHKRSDDGEEIESQRFWIHENFSMPSAVNDLAIVELRKTLTFGDAIQKIDISTKKSVERDADEGGEISIAGWGFRSEWERADVLMHTKMRLLPVEECFAYRSFYIEELNEDHICSVAIDGMPCSGDSGAPIVSLKSKKVLGISSYLKDAEDGKPIGYNDCRASVPAVATRISSYIDWISDKTGIVFEP